MSIHVALHHKTSYKYDRLVNLGPQVVRLRPAPHSRTRILSYTLRIAPEKHFINWMQDPQSNYSARLVFEKPTREFTVEVDLVAEMAVLNPFDFFLEPAAEKFPFEYDTALEHELEPFQRKCWLTPKFMKYLRAVRADLLGDATIGQKKKAGAKVEAKKLRTNDFLVALNQRLWKDIKYTIRLEPGVQTPEETLEKSSGSCRDSAWLLCQLLRHCGLAARFVSGYLIQLKADVKSLDGPSGTEKDFTDLHAWTEVFLPGAGWIGLDPTSGLFAGEGHIPLACTPDPSSAAPISGAVDECKCEFGFEMSIKRIYESPRVTLPYSDEQWNKIESLGHAIDADLKKGDVRLTMGGEPTFVSVDDPDGAEWNFTAVSEKKRILSGELIKRLRRQFAPGSLLHYGQGKWYPGEQLPRWALGCYWRKDGVPIWKDDGLIADESKNYGHDAKDAKALLERISRVVGADPKYMVPAYEDAFYYTWKERRLPSNVTPEKSNLKDKLERDRIARIFQKGLDEVVGYTLPIKRAWYGNQPGWMSGAWFLRDDDTLWLIPGDSAMGLRLPLDSIPWVAEKEFPWIRQQDPSQPKLPELPKEFPYRTREPETTGQRFVRRSGGAPLPAGYGPGQRAQQLDDLEEERVELPPLPPEYDPNQRPVQGKSAPWIIRTALCVEPRDGRLHIFMPPVATAEDYLDLIAGIETAVTEMGTPVIIEGETPPRDPRLNKLAVTPDPGVIEVNLHPSKSWDELVERTTMLYEEARLTRLGTEKFMVDGRHTGTGGGNHIIIGGDTPQDSPVLRRPDLLRSLIAYWQNHPSLSWLFSSLFIGPTSQAPRIDEARNDSLYELEVAFKELDRNLNTFGYTPPWLCDRLFRNLLTDASGNTHRSEFSIDKMFSPESGAGRLGLVEMRAFEMPPHARMSLAQHLLLRGLVAKFWNQPYKNDLVRWGTDIHDRWMLPHFCETDFRDVIGDLREAGYPFEFEWFAPHFEFRFPFIGDLEQRDIQVELRTALEPWHVLGEEPGGGGTVRYVDSSLERLQVKARGLIGDRFAITVNGCRIPLHPTGVNGEGVAGVRYRAWQPPECLQPTIGVHAPLRFDLHDTWNKRSLGGCTYHVAHPGGRSYDAFPVNSYEAESRRLARFFRHGHSPGNIELLPPVKILNFLLPWIYAKCDPDISEMRYDILHRTHYSYLSPARESFNDIRLEPPSIPEQTVESYALRVEPETRVSRYTDFYSTLIHHFEIPAEHSSLLIESKARVNTHWPKPLPENENLCPVETLGDAVHAERCFDFLQSSRYVDLDVDIWKLAIDTLGKQKDAWQAALALMRFTNEYITYVPNSTNAHTHVRDVIANRCGVCQDFAHFMIGLCRSVNIPTRYISGYLATEIASATHAWVEIYLPKIGWRALDPTHNCQVSGTYVKIGHGRDYADVPPVSGNYHGTLERTMSVEVKITPLDKPTDVSPAKGGDSTQEQKSSQQSQTQEAA